MSNQDLDVRITKEYIGDFAAIKNALDNIIDTFNRLMRDFSESAEQVSSGAAQVSSASMDLAHGATQQASTIEELTATIQSIAVQTSENAENAKEADMLSSATKQDGVNSKN